MKKVDEIYSSDSFRTIGTAKYLANQNNLKLLFDNKIICDDKMKNPMIFKINYEGNKIINIEYIGLI